MTVILYVSRACHHRAILERWLEDENLEFEVVFAEDDPEIGVRHGLLSSPNLVVDDVVRFAGMPSRKQFLEWVRQVGSARATTSERR